MPGRDDVRAFLGLGGNLGNPLQAMAEALRIVDADPLTRVVAASSVYLTPPWGPIEQPDFLNAVAELRTCLPARGLLELCLGAEQKLKRIRMQPGGPRLIDVDILLYDDERHNEPDLQVPHPRMLARAFVLLPLSEIAPDLVIGGRAVTERLDEVDRTGIAVATAGGDWWRE
ncbi:2-amino-4-hydroxy-6-hydroxymethyldihydropteridine diphosphokinase [Mesorhizobium xinjiangense]|uniref:2-amino-4-hydroxy-6- hydroxymethyldihydropteridine diphosphokinase n=1 Tax=Mesorhizobium xinjiangense TaxID=2678685 RepID=UPI001F31F9CE|nr:2-amino-4-hydroxy-6-hydroxymethyldihydropteridine diphosphokinase [Mesorhizobium xinjiangense]